LDGTDAKEKGKLESIKAVAKGERRREEKQLASPVSATLQNDQKENQDWSTNF